MSRSFGNNFSSINNTSSRMPIAPGTEWEDLRKQARQHENEIDTKLMSLSKLCSNYVAHDQLLHSTSDSSSSTSTSSSSFETMSMEIDKLLERLSDINKRMSDVVPALLGPNSAATHTLQRHHEILQDYRREFDRTKANIRNCKKREDLLVSTNTNNSTDVTIQGLSSRRQDYYLREMGHLNSSHKLMDTNLEMASMIKKDLSDQRRYLLNITTKVNSIANRFPLVNNVLQKIKLKKRKDSLVLGVVIAICFLILLLYMFR
jgi:golgi SNAP receptor complex member 1